MLYPRVKDEGLELRQELLNQLDLNSDAWIGGFKFSKLDNQHFQLALEVSGNIFVLSFLDSNLSIYSNPKTFSLGYFMYVFEHLYNLGHDNNFFDNFLNDVWHFNDSFLSNQDWI